MPPNLSVRELTILKYIVEFRAEKGYAPSMREIGKALGIPSTSLISYYLDKLTAAGRIKRDPAVARGIVVVAEAQG